MTVAARREPDGLGYFPPRVCCLLFQYERQDTKKGTKWPEPAANINDYCSMAKTTHTLSKSATSVTSAIRQARVAGQFSSAESRLLADLPRLIRRVLHDTGDAHIECCAEQLGIPVRTLQRKLQKLGVSYSAMLHELRCQEACLRLRSTRSSVAEIAGALGYSDPSHFSCAFRQWTGTSPRRFREGKDQAPQR